MSWTRMAATRQLLDGLGDEDVIVSSLSCATIDVWNTRDRARNFYLFGGMGMAGSIALGIAATRPDLRIVALEGDGALLMNLGSLATLAVMAPPNLTLIVWDNGVYESTGSQLTHSGRGVDLCAIARAAGLGRSETVRTPDEFAAALDRAGATPGPAVIVAKVAGGTDKSKCPPWTPVWFKERFVQAIAA
ncbi:thiamine pyrophosphate-dependent enzyme [Falsiroseomonas sp. HW251]|uniref:thiamine pyrophosphate-dependent enzyme n=1 Tax=Falsiroseomonas sp. HW251 TaxID=3390998 RepID=UPI003D321F98